jgi:hypothetical protein
MLVADRVEIVRLCGQLPLAVRIAGALLTGRPYWPLARLVERLAGERMRPRGRGGRSTVSAWCCPTRSS